MIKHVVLLKLHDPVGTTVVNMPPNKEIVSQQINSMAQSIPEIQGIEVCFDVPYMDRMWDIGLYLTFNNEDDRIGYFLNQQHIGITSYLNSNVKEKFMYHYHFIYCRYIKTHFHLPLTQMKGKKLPAKPVRKKK